MLGKVLTLGDSRGRYQDSVPSGCGTSGQCTFLSGGLLTLNGNNKNFRIVRSTGDKMRPRTWDLGWGGGTSFNFLSLMVPCP